MKLNDKEKKNYSFKKFYENLAKQQDIKYYAKPTGIHRKKKIIKMLSPTKNDTICDMGCGDGNLSGSLVKKARQVTGVDISQKRVNRAKGKGIDAICADIHSTPFGSNSFDKVICSEVLEHVFNPYEVITEIYRILKQGGTLVISVPVDEDIDKTILVASREDIENMDYELIKKKYSIEHCHLTSFSKRSIIKTLEETGFEIIQIDYTNNYKPIFKNKKIYETIYGMMVEIKVNNHRITEKLFNIFISLVYRKEKTFRHIIISAKKSNKGKIWLKKTLNS